MNEGLIPRRYAKALLKVALDRGQSQRLYTLLNNFINQASAEPSFQSTVANPFVSLPDKIELIKTAAQAQADDVTFADFLKLLSQNKRLDKIVPISREYIRLYREMNNIHIVSVASAAPMSEAESQRIEALVKTALPDANLQFTFQTNPELIGGFSVEVDNQKLDASLSTELKQLRVALLK